MSAEDGLDESGRTVIGISFGNSYSSIAHTNASDGKSEVIANEEGDRQIPSILSYVAGEEFQGTQAKAQIVRNPRNTIAYFRDFLGKTFSEIDPSHSHSSAHPLEADGGKAVAFQVQEHASAEEGEGDEPEKSTLTVSEVTTRYLRTLKQSATDYIGRPVNAAVVTIPSDFGDAQKSALHAAAAQAGIEVLQFIPEPISALLAHDAKLQQSGELGPSAQPDKIVLVADLGGTRSDVAVVASRAGIYTTLATAHDFEFSGSALDAVLVEYAAKEFLKKNKSAADPRTQERSASKLTLEAEAVKKALSLGSSASFSIESLIDGHDFSLTVNRTRFELLANKVFMSLTRLIDGAVSKAALDPLDIDEILLSGGTSHVPKIAANLAAHFPESTFVIAPSTSPTAVNPSELTARGAAIQASLIAEFEPADIAESTEPVVAVTPHLPHAIGVVGADGKSLAVLVAPATPVPVRRTAQIAVPAGGDVLVRLAEGVREIKVSQVEKAATNGNKDDDSDEDSDEDDSDDEPEEVREKVWKVGAVLAEAGVRGVKKGGKVEVQVNVAADLGVTVVVREVGGKGGVRGTIETAA